MPLWALYRVPYGRLAFALVVAYFFALFLRRRLKNWLLVVSAFLLTLTTGAWLIESFDGGALPQIRLPHQREISFSKGSVHLSNVRHAKAQELAVWISR